MSDFDVLVQQVNVCTLCTLSAKRTNAVPGEGSRTADIMFIGEGPGFHEDRLARPFVGPAGKFLDELLPSIAPESRRLRSEPSRAWASGPPSFLSSACGHADGRP